MDKFYLVRLNDVYCTDALDIPKRIKGGTNTMISTGFEVNPRDTYSKYGVKRPAPASVGFHPAKSMGATVGSATGEV